MSKEEMEALLAEAYHEWARKYLDAYPSLVVGKVVLPISLDELRQICATIGSRVYEVCDDYIVEGVLTDVGFDCDGNLRMLVGTVESIPTYDIRTIDFPVTEFGKTIFPTKEEAETALAKLKQEGQHND